MLLGTYYVVFSPDCLLEGILTLESLFKISLPASTSVSKVFISANGETFYIPFDLAVVITISFPSNSDSGGISISS